MIPPNLETPSFRQMAAVFGIAVITYFGTRGTLHGIAGFVLMGVVIGVTGHTVQKFLNWREFGKFQ